MFIHLFQLKKQFAFPCLSGARLFLIFFVGARCEVRALTRPTGHTSFGRRLRVVIVASALRQKYAAFRVRLHPFCEPLDP